MTRVFPLDFLGDGALLQPRDRELHDLAVDYCKQEVTEEVNLARLAKVWVCADVDDSGKPVKVTGVSGYVMKPDVPLFRATSHRATAMLAHRMNDFFADQGCRGQEVFLHISSKEKPEQRCSGWEEELKAAGASPSDRYSVVVR